MSDLSNLLNVTRTALGLNDDQTQHLGQTLQREMNGRIYINKPTLEPRNQEIRSAFNGRNLHELARQYGLSDRQIREIVR